MPSLTFRAAFAVGLFFALSSVVQANDTDIPDPIPGLAPVAPYAGPAPVMAAPVPQNGPYWAPGGNAYTGMRPGSPYYWSAPGYNAGYYGAGGWGMPYGYGQGYGYPGAGYGYGYPGAYYGGGYGYGGGMDAYTYHFGPGFYRNGAEQGSYRFPYYSYRRPWYTPGPPSYNRDTNLPW